MIEHGSSSETEYECQSWSFQQITGVIENNPGNTSLLEELESRQRSLESNKELVNAVRNRIGGLFGGEYKFDDRSKFVEIEEEIARQFPEVVELRYKGMIAETIHAVCQEWKFRGEKNVYTEDDEERLSPQEKEELNRILSRQHIKTGITGQHLATFNSITVAGPQASNPSLVEGIASLIRVVGPDSIKYVLPSQHEGGKNHSEFREDLPNDIQLLTQIIQDNSLPAGRRESAGKKIFQMFKEAGSLGLRRDWLVDFETHIRIIFNKAGDWQNLSVLISEFIDRFDEVNFAGGISAGRDSFSNLAQEYQTFVGRHSNYKGLVTAVLAGVQRYAEKSNLLNSASDVSKIIYEGQIQDIANFQIPLPGLKELIGEFAQKITTRVESSTNDRREGAGKTSSAGERDERKTEHAERNAKHKEGASRAAGAKYEEELPEGITEQRAFLMDKLKRIKNSRRMLKDISGFNRVEENLFAELNSLMEYLQKPHCDKELAREILARLRLYNCAQLMVLANNISNPSEFLRKATEGDNRFLLDESNNGERYLDEKGKRETDTEVIFGIKGVKEAFLIIQEAEVKWYYERQGKDITVNKNKPSREEEILIDNRILEDMINAGFSEEYAKEALELAREYYQASGERWVWDREFARHPKFSSLVYVSEWRNESKADRDRGLPYNINNIESLGVTSYLRGCRVEQFDIAKDGKKIQKYLFLPKPEYNLELIAENQGFGPFSPDRSLFKQGSYKLWDDGQRKEVVVISHKPYPDARRAFCARNWGVDIQRNNQIKYVDPAQFDSFAIKPGEYRNFIDRICNAFELLEWIRRSAFNPEDDFTSDKLQRLRELSIRVDSTGFLNINFWMAYGILCYYKNNPSKWPTESKFEELMKNLADLYSGLVSEEQMRIIKNKVFGEGFLGRMLGADVMVVIHRIINRIWIELSPERR